MTYIPKEEWDRMTPKQRWEAKNPEKAKQQREKFVQTKSVMGITTDGYHRKSSSWNKTWDGKQKREVTYKQRGLFGKTTRYTETRTATWHGGLFGPAFKVTRKKKGWF